MGIRFYKWSIGEQDVVVTKDNDKLTFYNNVQTYLKLAIHEFKNNRKVGLMTSLISLINISLKVPDMILIKNAYYAIGLYCEYVKDYNNALYAYAKLRGAAEGDEDFEGC